MPAVVHVLTGDRLVIRGHRLRVGAVVLPAALLGTAEALVGGRRGREARRLIRSRKEQQRSNEGDGRDVCALGWGIGGRLEYPRTCCGC